MRFARRSALVSALVAASMLAAPGAAVPTADSVSSSRASEKNAMPEPSRRGRRYMHQVLELTGLGGGGVVPGGAIGYDWIHRRTNGFRRKGVGSKWRYTKFAGRA